MDLAKDYGSEIEMYESIKEMMEHEIKKYTPKEKLKNIVLVSRCEKECDEFGIDKAAALEISQEIEETMGIPPSSKYLRLVIDGLKNSNEKQSFTLSVFIIWGRNKVASSMLALRRTMQK